MNGGSTSMFSDLTATAITGQATTMSSNFDGPVLTAVGIGVAFACVRFVVGLFY